MKKVKVWASIMNEKGCEIVGQEIGLLTISECNELIALLKQCENVTILEGGHADGIFESATLEISDSSNPDEAEIELGLVFTERTGE